MKVVVTNQPDALPHTDFFTLLTAAGLAHQKVTFHKDVRIVDMSGILPPEANGDILSVEITPQKPDNPGLSGTLMGWFEEDLEYGTISFHVLKDKDEIAPFQMNLSVFSRTTLDVNFKTNLAFAKTEEYLDLHRYIEKMKKSKYRRFYIVNSVGERVLVAGNPNMRYDYDQNEIDLVQNIRNLEELSKEEIGIPHQLHPNFVSSVQNLIEKWEELTEEERTKQLKMVVNSHGQIKFTSYKVILKNEQGEIQSVIYKEFDGWLRYQSFGVHPTSSSAKANWQRIVKTRGEMMSRMKNRVFRPEEFYHALANNPAEKILLNTIFELQKISATEMMSCKTDITIIYHKPVVHGWSHFQMIEIELLPTAPSFNQLEELNKAKKFKEALPLLEEFKDSFIENLAFSYILNERYDDAIRVSDEIIQMDMRTVAHFTKGLGYVGNGDYKAAYRAYELAVHACSSTWHPIAKENLEKLICEQHIQSDGTLKKIIDMLNRPIQMNQDNEKCYCGSGKKFKNCHGKIK